MLPAACAVPQHFSASHRPRIAPLAILGLPRPSRIAPFPAFPALCCSWSVPCGATDPRGPVDLCGLLRSDLSTLCTFCLGACAGSLPALTPRSSHRSQIALRSTLGVPLRVRIAPLSWLPARRCLRIAPYATLSARTRHESLRARHLAFHTGFGLLRSRCFPPCASCGLLRARRLTLTASLGRLLARPLVPAPLPNFPLRFHPFPALGSSSLPADCSAFHSALPDVSFRISPSLTSKCFLLGPVVSL